MIVNFGKPGPGVGQKSFILSERCFPYKTFIKLICLKGLPDILHIIKNIIKGMLYIQKHAGSCPLLIRIHLQKALHQRNQEVIGFSQDIFTSRKSRLRKLIAFLKKYIQ
jgi:hypothetical protein